MTRENISDAISRTIPTRTEKTLFLTDHRCRKRHRYDDIIMGFYGKAFDNDLQAKAVGSKPILLPANQNLGHDIVLKRAFPCALPFRSLTITLLTSLV